MHNRNAIRGTVLFAILALFFFGMWRFGFLSGDSPAPQLDGGGQYEAGQAGERTIIAGEKRPEPVDDEPAVSVARPKDGGTERNRQVRRNPGRTEHEVEPDIETDAKVRTHRWLAVDEFGSPIPHALFVLNMRRGGTRDAWEVKSDAGGILDLPLMALRTRAHFQSLHLDSDAHAVEAVGQIKDSPLLRDTIVRVMPKGVLRIRLVDSEGKDVDHGFKAMLFPRRGMPAHGQPDHVSPPSDGGLLEWNCPAGEYQVVLAPQGAIHHKVFESWRKAAVVRVHYGLETELRLNVEGLKKRSWPTPQDLQSGPFEVELVGSGQVLSALTTSGLDWKYIPQSMPGFQPSGMHLGAVATPARIISGELAGSLVFVDAGRLFIMPAKKGMRALELGVLAGNQTTIRSFSGPPLSYTINDGRVPVVQDRIQCQSPDWIEIQAKFDNDPSWKQATARMQFAYSTDPLNLGKAIAGKTLDLANATPWRSSPPTRPGMRWTTTKGPLDQLVVTADLRSSPSLAFQVPTLVGNGRPADGHLGWTPEHVPGTLGVGTWPLRFSKDRSPAPPGFRTFQIQCVQPDGNPAPHAMVQVRSSGRTWRGSADSKGLLKLETLGDAALMVDSGLLANPMQLSLDRDSSQQGISTLVVPKAHHRIHIAVAGDGPQDKVTATLSLRYPGGPDDRHVIRERMGADGELILQGLLPTEYQVEVADLHSHRIGVSRTVKLTALKPNAEVRFELSENPR